jgi:FlaA1/EpsC-like NDP-sugar epimerase
VPSKTKPVLIIGAGVAGEIVAEILSKSQSKDFLPIGFVDDDPGKLNLVLYGLPVLGTMKNIPALVIRHHIEEIIIAIPSASGKVVAEIVQICHQSRARLKILPGFYDLITGKIKTSNIRDIEVDDLLGRDPVSLDLEKIAGYLTNQVVLVTGAGGSIGSELCRQVANFYPKKLILLGRGENSIYEMDLELKEKHPELKFDSEIGDIKDQARMNQIFSRHKPNVVFHAAAHKHVPFMERCPGEALKNNVFGSLRLAESACRSGTGTFVLISSDKAVKPASVMGATKRVAEKAIQYMQTKGSTRFTAVRFGNVLGSRGSVIPLFKRQIARGGPLTITHPDMVRYFMTTAEAAQLVIQAGAQAHGGEIFILDMGKPVKIVDLAKNLIQLSGLEPDTDIPIRFTGIRQGEKLVEQLVGEGEEIVPTNHERIFAVSESGGDFSKLESFLETLERTNLNLEEQEVIVLLQSVLPNFKK